MDSAFRQRINFIISNLSENSEINETITKLNGQEVVVRGGGREEFLQKCLNIRAKEFVKSGEFIREGIREVVPIQYLNIFTPKELGDLVTGEIASYYC